MIRKTVIRVKKVKLPRKRKKACIKAIGRVHYYGILLVNELSFEDNWDKMDRRFPKSYYENSVYRSNRVKEYW